jgi:hypothetical protein
VIDKPAYQHYLKLPYWSNLEAICLLSGICPTQYVSELPFIFRSDPLSGFYPCPPKIEMFQRFMQPVWFKFEMSQKNEIEPIAAINWAVQQGFDIPVELMKFEAEKNKIPTTAPPIQSKEKTSIYNDRDNDFKAWIESEKPQLADMNKREIHKRLIERNLKLWCIGGNAFDSWWLQQKIYKARRGRKSKINR